MSKIKKKISTVVGPEIPPVPEVKENGKMYPFATTRSIYFGRHCRLYAHYMNEAGEAFIKEYPMEPGYQDTKEFKDWQDGK